MIERGFNLNSLQAKQHNITTHFAGLIRNVMQMRLDAFEYGIIPGQLEDTDQPPDQGIDHEAAEVVVVSEEKVEPEVSGQQETEGQPEVLDQSEALEQLEAPDQETATEEADSKEPESGVMTE